VLHNLCSIQHESPFLTRATALGAQSLIMAKGLGLRSVASSCGMPLSRVFVCLDIGCYKYGAVVAVMQLIQPKISVAISSRIVRLLVG
jgi:hypothetical protein